MTTPMNPPNRPTPMEWTATPPQRPSHARPRPPAPQSGDPQVSTAVLDQLGPDWLRRWKATAVPSPATRGSHDGPTTRRIVPVTRLPGSAQPQAVGHLRPAAPSPLHQAGFSHAVRFPAATHRPDVRLARSVYTRHARHPAAHCDQSHPHPIVRPAPTGGSPGSAPRPAAGHIHFAHIRPPAQNPVPHGGPIRPAIRPSHTGGSPRTPRPAAGHHVPAVRIQPPQQPAVNGQLAAAAVAGPSHKRPAPVAAAAKAHSVFVTGRCDRLPPSPKSPEETSKRRKTQPVVYPSEVYPSSPLSPGGLCDRDHAEGIPKARD